MYVRDTMQKLLDNDIEEYNFVIRSVKILYDGSVHDINNILVEQSLMRRGTNTLHPVIPKNLIDFTRAQSGD